MGVDNTALLERQHGQSAAGMELSADAVVDHLAESSVISIGRWYELSWL